MSVKGVIPDRDRDVLLGNGRDEWEPPGGRSRTGETAEECVAREILKELGPKVEVGPLLDTWVLRTLPGRRVLVLAFGCFAGKGGRVAYGAGRTALGSFGLDALEEIDVSAGYALVARTWAGMARMDCLGF